MARYELELDDDQATSLIKLLAFTSTSGALSGYSAELSKTVAERIREQLPLPEPAREYLVKDREGDIWRWDERQTAWECITHRSGAPAFCRWAALVAAYSPVKLYAELPDQGKS